MQVTSLLSRQEDDHDHDHDHKHDDSCESCGHDHSHAVLPLAQTLIGLLFILNSFVVTWAFSDKSNPVAAASAMIGVIILGYPIVWTAIQDLRRGLLTTNELVALAVLASFGSANYQVTGYQQAGIIAFFMLMGQIIETRTAEGARTSIESLIKLTPAKARRISKQGEEEVATSLLAVGDVIRVRPGDNIAADGVIVSGLSSLNQANITGESLPVDKKPGDEVFASTQNLTGVLEIRVTRAGEDTTLGKVRELILAAEKTKLPIMRIIDNYMGFYTPLVLVIGALVWSFTGNLNQVIAVFIVACPCAFILATPSAMVAALSAAMRLGILIKNVGDIELAAKINAFVFDKTGTLTTGKLAVSRLAPMAGTTPAELLRVAGSAEKYSNHPTAKALAQLAVEAGVPLSEPKDFSETAGRGVSAQIDGAKVIVGRAQWLKDQGIAEDFLKSVDLNETEGFSLIFVGYNGKCIGWVGLQDQTRAEAREALAQLKAAGVRRIAMISGDRQPVATRVAREIGCEEAIGDCLPQNKVDFVRQIKAKGYRVAVVGDGVNDAPALAAGDLGIAMGAAGSEVAIHSATIALMNNDLRRLPFLVRLSRQTRSVINQNFLFGILFVIGGLTLAALNYLPPIAAAVLHVVGSLIVVFNSARLVRQGEEMEPHLALAAEPPASLRAPDAHPRDRMSAVAEIAPAPATGEKPKLGQTIVAVRGLTKIFKDFWGRPKALAVDNVDFEVRKGEVFGLLGPNGSGKSTTVKLLLGLLYPTRGHIEVFGHSPRHVKTKAKIGYLPEESYLYRFLDSHETLNFFGNLFDLPPAERKKRTEELLEMVGLSKVRTRVVGEFSKGMQRRIGLAQALMNDPDLVILDEPTAGMDPIGCREVKDLILALARRGKTVILSSHLLSDVEDVCDRVVIYYGGRIRAMGTLKELLAKPDSIRITMPPLSRETMQQVLEIIRRDVAADKIEIDNPTQNLESYFLEVVRKAKESSAETSGATSGSHVAPYLKGDAGAAQTSERLLERLTVSAAPQPVEPVAAPKPVEKVDQAKLQSLAQPAAPLPAAPAEPTPAPPADLNKANEKLSSLLGKPNEK